MNDCFITLIDKTATGRTAIGEVEHTEKRTDALARSVPISRQEAFFAMQIGFRPEFEFIVNPLEYHGEGLLEFNGERYEIYRTYEPNSNEVELYCRKSIGGNGQ